MQSWPNCANNDRRGDLEHNISREEDKRDDVLKNSQQRLLRGKTHSYVVIIFLKFKICEHPAQSQMRS